MNATTAVNRNGPPDICPNCANDVAGTFEWHDSILPRDGHDGVLHQTNTYSCGSCGNVRVRVFLPPAYEADG